MITPKDEARELIDKFYIQEIKYYENIETAKQCALIAVDEILFVLKYTCNCNDIESSTWFYNKVKQEIQNL